MGTFIDRFANYLSDDAPWTKAMAILVTLLATLIAFFVGTVTYQTAYQPDRWKVIEPLSVESFRNNEMLTIKYQMGLDSIEDFSGRFDNQLSCSSGAADILDSIHDVKRGVTKIVRHSIIPPTIKAGDTCTLEIGVTREILFSLSRSRKVISSTTFTIR